MPSGKFSAAGIKVQKSRRERVQSDNVFKPSLPSPSGHSISAQKTSKMQMKPLKVWVPSVRSIANVRSQGKAWE